MQKDIICHGSEIQQHDENVKKRRALSTLKRHPINHSQINYDQYTDEYLMDDEMDFQQINYNRQRKKRFINDKDEKVQARTIINSNNNNNRNFQATTNNECDPKLKD
jgi:hypothetical protein